MSSQQKNKFTKTLIFVCPKSFSIYKEIIKNLEYCGFDVTYLDYEESTYNYKKNIKHRIHNFLRKLLFRDFHYKSELEKQHYFKDANKNLKQLNTKIDYSLVIRADKVPKKTIKLLKSKSSFIIGYQWDGLDRYPEIYRYIKYFDRFYTFDSKDIDSEISYKNVLPVTNFYFDYKESIFENITVNSDLYFLGTFINTRNNEIRDFIKIIENLKQKINFKIYNPHDSESSINKKYYIKQYITYKENIENVKRTKILVDFTIPDHDGLSFRFFEAIQFEKKIITTNPSVKNFDFYNSSNIFLWNGSNVSELKAFIKTPYQKLHSNIRKKYCFSNWLNYILDL